jgi:hypothetical protein
MDPHVNFESRIDAISSIRRRSTKEITKNKRIEVVPRNKVGKEVG